MFSECYFPNQEQARAWAAEVALAKVAPIIGEPVLQHGTFVTPTQLRQFFDHGIVSEKYASEHGIDISSDRPRNKEDVYLHGYQPERVIEWWSPISSKILPISLSEKIPCVFLVDPKITSKLAVPHVRRVISHTTAEVTVQEKIPPEFFKGVVLEYPPKSETLSNIKRGIKVRIEIDKGRSFGALSKLSRLIVVHVGVAGLDKMIRNWWEDLTEDLGEEGFLELVKNKGNYLFPVGRIFSQENTRWVLLDGLLHFVNTPFSISEVGCSQEDILDFCRLVIRNAPHIVEHDRWFDSADAKREIERLRKVCGGSDNPVMKFWFKELEEQLSKVIEIEEEYRCDRALISSLFPGVVQRLFGKKSVTLEEIKEYFPGQVRRVVEAMTEFPDLAVPIYDQNGNLHWPQEMTLEEIRQRQRGKLSDS